MKNSNIGIVISAILNEESLYVNENINANAVKKFGELSEIIKMSPILQLEYKVINNIESAHIDSELAGMKYIENNIKLFEVYTIPEIDAERKKISKFIKTKVQENEKTRLYEAIDTLITESLNDYAVVDVNKIHEANTLILEHLNEPVLNEPAISELDEINEEVIGIAIDKFNEKYSKLNEEEHKLFKLFISGIDKQHLLEVYKTDTLELLNGVDEINSSDNIKKSIDKINEMKYNKDTVTDDIIKLQELKTALL